MTSRPNQITEYGVGNTPRNIVLGPDGNLWYTLGGGDIVLPYDTGEIGTFNVTTHVSSNYSTPIVAYLIAAGPGNNLTFTSNSANQIGEIDATTKAINILQAGTFQRKLAWGPVPDGNAWSLGSSDITYVNILPPANVTLTATSTTSNLGDPVIFSVAVGPLPGSTLLPTGVVQFLDGNGIVATVRLNGNGVASFADKMVQWNSYSGLSLGTHVIKAIYLGDANYGESLSNLLTEQIVNSTTTTITADQNSSRFGQPVTLRATVHDASGNLVTSGVVSFEYAIPSTTFKLQHP